MINKDKKNTLYLVPIGLSESSFEWFLPHKVKEEIYQINFFIAENAKTARHFLKFISHPTLLPQIEIFELDKHNLDSQKDEIKNILQKNDKTGLISEAGMPCIADPGNHIVKMAHLNHILVKPLVGPSSILLALIASGMNGQQFKFNGYLPQKPDERKQTILKLEIESNHTTQLFIETPYRNDKFLAEMCQILKPNTMLLVAIDLTGENEKIISKPISWYKGNAIEIGKLPCVFGIGV